jgi:hypothetical protein
MRELGYSKGKLRELAGAGRGSCADEVFDRARVGFEVVYAERKRHAFARSEGVDEEGKWRATRVLEKKRRPICLRRPVGDGGDLEHRVDATPDAHQLAALLERTNERAHSVPRHGVSALRAIFDDAF